MIRIVIFLFSLQVLAQQIPQIPGQDKKRISGNLTVGGINYSYNGNENSLFSEIIYNRPQQYAPEYIYRKVGLQYSLDKNPIEMNDPMTRCTAGKGCLTVNHEFCTVVDKIIENIGGKDVATACNSYIHAITSNADFKSLNDLNKKETEKVKRFAKSADVGATAYLGGVKGSTPFSDIEPYNAKLKKTGVEVMSDFRLIISSCEAMRGQRTLVNNALAIINSDKSLKKYIDSKDKSQSTEASQR